MVLHLVHVAILLVGLALHLWGPTPKAQSIGLALFTAAAIALLLALPGRSTLSVGWN